MNSSIPLIDIVKWVLLVRLFYRWKNQGLMETCSISPQATQVATCKPGCGHRQSAPDHAPLPLRRFSGRLWKTLSYRRWGTHVRDAGPWRPERNIHFSQLPVIQGTHSGLDRKSDPRSLDHWDLTLGPNSTASHQFFIPESAAVSRSQEKYNVSFR